MNRQPNVLAVVRRLWWKRVRRYGHEICGECIGGPGQATIRRYGCGRPIGLVWRGPTPLWNFVVAGIDKTVITVRSGAAVNDLAPRAEGVGGVLCLMCFARAAEDRGFTQLVWRPEGIGDYAS